MRSIALFISSLCALMPVTSMARGATDGGPCRVDDGGASRDCSSDSSAHGLLSRARGEHASGALIRAIRLAQQAVEKATQDGDGGEVIVEARALVKTLTEYVPHVTFVPPKGAEDLWVTFDDRPVPIEALTKKFSVDPGRHLVRAGGTSNGVPQEFEAPIELQPRDFVSVHVVLTAVTPPCTTCASSAESACLRNAKTSGDALACSKSAEPSHGCRACLIAPTGTSTPGVVALVPLFAFCMRRAGRRTARRVGVRPRIVHPH